MSDSSSGDKKTGSLIETTAPVGPTGLAARVIALALENRIAVIFLTIALLFFGLRFMPFPGFDLIPRDPIPVDAIPDIGENQQIVFTDWPGRSPQDVEDQVTWPLSVELQGIPGVKNVRSFSWFGFSTIYVIFEEQIDFYWSRSRILEKLNQAGRLLPSDAVATLGPDATALGQVFLYTLEGEGFSLEELRSIQDFQVKQMLQRAEGVSEVASIGGFVREYQIDLDPDRLDYYGIGLSEVFRAVSRSNLDIGAGTLESNRVEYLIRGIGLIENLDEIAAVVVREAGNVPVRISDLGTVSRGPAPRRGILDKQGEEAVGGIVTVRYGANPMEVIRRVKEEIERVAAALPTKELEGGRSSRVKIVPYYDRTGLIEETLGTLSHAIADELMVTVIVILFFLVNFRSSLLISLVLPLTVLAVFIGMKAFRVDSNIMSLSGIAIAIGTVVDMGIVVTENFLKHRQRAAGGGNPGTTVPVTTEMVWTSTAEVAPSIITAVLTTVVSFLPVFLLTEAEGKLFKPLAYTKTFALFAALLLALILLPVLISLVYRPAGAPLRSFLSRVGQNRRVRLFRQAAARLPGAQIMEEHRLRRLVYPAVMGLLFIFFAARWEPLGEGRPLILQLLFTLGIILIILLGYRKFQQAYPRILAFFLRKRALFLSLMVLVLAGGITGWMTMGKEFMPPLDEGSFLLMPTTMPHASVEEAHELLQRQNRAISAIPEVEDVVGKIGRAETALDPAPISMVETVITYKPEYRLDESSGKRVRQWRDEIQSSRDIWDEIVRVTRFPGSTSAPFLQPISARIVMLQSGMRAPMGIVVSAETLEELEAGLSRLEPLVKEVEEVAPDTVNADRLVGKPYLEVHYDRLALSRFGLNVGEVQQELAIAVGGGKATRIIEGREHYSVRLRYQREKRASIEDIENILIPLKSRKGHIRLSQVAEIRYRRGPMVIKSEEGFITGYLLFDRKPQHAEVDTVEAVKAHLAARADEGEWDPSGLSLRFAGNYENQQRSRKRLALVIPAALTVIFMLIFLQFRSLSVTLFIFSAVFITMSGGFILLALYRLPWLLNFSILGTSMRELFNLGPVNLSVAVWVGFIALFGIATDDGVLMAGYIESEFRNPASSPSRGDQIQRLIQSASLRVRPCLMTTATTVLALIPVVTSSGRGSDVMVPMALPLLGGMLIELVTLFVVPVLYSFRLKGVKSV